MEDEYEHPYIGTKDEEMDAEGEIVDAENRIESALCQNCLERNWTKVIGYSNLCDPCAEANPKGMPF